MIFPSENTFDGWRLASSDNIVRRLIGDDKIHVEGVLDLVTGSNSITDIKISLNTNLTRLTNYYTKTESTSILALKTPLASPVSTGAITVSGTLACSGQMTGKMFFCAGKINADGAKAFTSSSGLTDFTRVGSSNQYQMTLGTSHPAGTNYVIQVTGQGAIANVSNSTVPTATGSRLVMYSAASTWPTAATAPFFFSVLH